jgi:TonB-dependent receptor
MDLRLAATQSLARPNFASLVPFQIIDDQNRTAQLGNPDLEHTTALNLDAYLSIYGDKFGLFTIGGFYKELENVEFLSQTRRIEPGDPLNTYLITTPRNAIGTTYLRGIEFDYQTNFRWLPSPFDGIVLNANLTLVESETFYPFFDVITQVTPPFETIVIDTERKGTMPGQSDILANVSLGYEKGGFSGRISMVHQGAALFAVGSREEGDVYTVATTRWDLALSQRVNKSWTVFVNLNNITNQEEAAFFGDERFSSNIEFFGFTADLGVKFRLRR